MKNQIFDSKKNICLLQINHEKHLNYQFWLFFNLQMIAKSNSDFYDSNIIYALLTYRKLQKIIYIDNLYLIFILSFFSPKLQYFLKRQNIIVPILYNILIQLNKSKLNLYLSKKATYTLYKYNYYLYLTNCF